MVNDVDDDMDCILILGGWMPNIRALGIKKLREISKYHVGLMLND